MRQTPESAVVGRIRDWLGARRPEVVIVLGSGLGGFIEGVRQPTHLRFDAVPGLPTPSVAGHPGEFVAGSLGGRTVLCQSGRFHHYEGADAALAALPARLAAALGVRILIVTNAAGGIRRSFRPGTLMRIADHINLTFRNPLHGPPRFGEPRFPDMSAPYDPALGRFTDTVARELGIALDVGVYAGVTGPSYETPAEVRMLERLGADAVGMSTVTEVIVARAAGVRCLGISTVTNPASGLGHEPLRHAEVVAASARVAASLGRLLAALVARLDGQAGPDAGSRAGTV